MGRKIYLVRHGKPNIEGDAKRCIGITDILLSDAGIKQAERIGKWLSLQKRCRIYSSPLKRCLQTARIIKDTGVGTSAIRVREDLHEMVVGLWENMTFGEIKEKYPDEYTMRGGNLGYFAPPKGESFDEAGRRFEACLDEIRKESDDDIVIVAHAGVIRGYLCRLKGISANEVMKFPQPYGGMTILDEDINQSPVVVKVGWKPYNLLEKEDICSMYKKCGTPEHVVRHMESVALLIDKMRENFSEDIRNSYDWDLIRKAALVHDITRTRKNHPETGADFLVKEGYPEIAQLVRYHHDVTIQEGPLAAEEILFYADKRVQEDQVVSLEERFEKSKEKCLSETALKKHQKMYEKAKCIEKKCETLSQMQLNIE